MISSGLLKGIAHSVMIIFIWFWDHVSYIILCNIFTSSGLHLFLFSDNPMQYCYFCKCVISVLRCEYNWESENQVHVPPFSQWNYCVHVLQDCGMYGGLIWEPCAPPDAIIILRGPPASGGVFDFCPLDWRVWLTCFFFSWEV